VRGEVMLDLDRESGSRRSLHLIALARKDLSSLSGRGKAAFLTTAGATDAGYPLRAKWEGKLVVKHSLSGMAN